MNLTSVNCLQVALSHIMLNELRLPLIHLENNHFVTTSAYVMWEECLFFPLVKNKLTKLKLG